MKRCLSVALILALFGTTAASPALAEGLDVVGEAAEASVVEIGLLEDLAFDDEELPEALEESLEEPGEPEEEEDASEASDMTEADEEEAAPEEEEIPEEADAEAPEEEEIPEEADAEEPEEEEAPAEDEDPEAADEEEEEESSDESGMDEFVEEEVISEETASDTADGAAAGIKLAVTTVTIGVKEKYTVAAATTDGSALPAITWRSSNAKIAKVNASTGVVTGVKEGSATIYAKPTKGGTEVKCKVTVKEAPSKVTLDSTALSLSAGMSAQLKATLPKDTASAAMTWTSNKTSVATVDAGGKITAVKAGTATITVKTFNGKKDTCKVTVVAAPTAVSFPDSIVPMAVGQTTTVKATAHNAKGAEVPATITYAIDASSPNPGCVTVNASTGELKAVSKGRAYLKATAQNGVSSLCQIDVDVAPKAIELNVSSISIGVKEVYVGVNAKLIAPDGANSCAQIVSWSSSDKSIAKVDANTGAITGVKAGSATITATTPNGKTAKCKVKVLKAPTSISVSPAVGTLNVGEKGQYKVTLSSGAGGSLSYESSNTNVAIIDSTGMVTAVGPGAAKITVTTYNGKSKTVELMVNGSWSDSDDGSKSGNAEKIAYLLSIARSKLDKPYVYGSFGPNSFDCSGFAYWCFKQINIKLKDSAYKQGYDTTYQMVSYSQLQPGDLVFFNTVDDSDLSDHTGIYLGNGQFIHASSSAGKVIISKLNSGYYQRNFSWGRRVFS